MPLYIRDESVNALAQKLADVRTHGNKTEAVRFALMDALERSVNEQSLSQRVRKHQDRAADLGLRPDGFDDKVLMDDLSGDL